MTYEQKLRAVAHAFMLDDPEEYKNDTIEEVIEQLRSCNDEKFIDHSYECFVEPKVIQ